MNGISTAVALFLLLANSTVARAEFPPMKLVVENLSPAAAKCGITEEAIGSALLSAFRYNRIEPDQNSLMMTYVNLSVMESSGYCQIVMRLSVQGFGPARFGSSYLLTYSEFCWKGSQFTNYRASDAGEVYTAIKNKFDQCLAEIDAKTTATSSSLRAEAARMLQSANGH